MAKAAKGLTLRISPIFPRLSPISTTSTTMGDNNFTKIEVLLNWNKQMLESARKGKYQNRTYVDIPGSLSPNAPSTSAFAKDGSSHVCGSNP